MEPLGVGLDEQYAQDGTPGLARDVDLIASIPAAIWRGEAGRPGASAYLGELAASLPADNGEAPGRSPGPTTIALPEPLTDQEQLVLQLLVEGLSNREIGERLVVTVGTAKWHVHNVYAKLGVHNRVAAIRRAGELGLR